MGEPYNCIETIERYFVLYDNDDIDIDVGTVIAAWSCTSKEAYVKKQQSGVFDTVL
jgi:hypothetical protein